ncbi:hypothetical protein Gbem_2790 [Citrifermentans bemidjiense Bem]|uniref:Uncharacterized protein n=1 Tax=Citrifermentans bemidjiense (strain ATCC BAA-1014 / DSM 16622 / JCM 12645 / Bem) TaxID=404380 RepID=B5EI92_CITBB|nr:hypothetical protein [Citrifermentans bemidjiense]ACH39794.1 hypothetical protein Gbem_2790 [Citrifermentans bemidjiense Bem]
MVEIIGLILGVLGVVFAFETPRRSFAKLIGIKDEPAIENLALQSIRSGGTFGDDLEIKEPNNLVALAITPKDIVNKRDHLSEIEFDEYFNSFIGHTVIWEGRICTVSLKNGGEAVRIQMTFSDQRLRAFFDINLKDYPNVRLFKANDTATVTGKIYSPDWPTFDLEDSKILNWTKKN